MVHSFESAVVKCIFDVGKLHCRDACTQLGIYDEKNFFYFELRNIEFR